MSPSAFALPLSLVVGALGAARIASRTLGGDERELSFGARVACGIALLAAVAGWLVAGGVYSRGAVLGLLGLSGAGLLLAPRMPGAPLAAPSARSVLGFALLGAFVLARVLGAMRFPRYNPCDDWVAYLHFPRMLLESGGFEEPFSMRRLGVLGVGPFVQGFFWPHFGVSANALADAFFGQLAVIGGARALHLAVAPARPSPASGALLALAALLLTLTIPSLNTLPVLLPFGVALLLLALHARAVLSEPRTFDALAFGALAALLIGLRVTNAVLPAALWAFETMRAVARRDRARMRYAALAALATALALLPWCISLWRSSGTPLFPLWLGNYRFPTLFTEPLTARGLARFVAEGLLANRVPVLIGLVAVACARPGHRVLALQVGTAAFVFALTATLGVTAFDSWTVLRYCAPLVVPALLLLGALSLFAGPEPAPRWQRPTLAALALIWLLAPVTTHRAFAQARFSMLSFAARDAETWTTALRSALRDRFVIEDFGGRPPYLKAQSLLPPDARVVSTAEQAYLWRHDLHVIHGLDCLGQASPDPGMPFFAGAEAMANYFTSLGYTHLAFTPPRRSFCLYSYAHWDGHRTHGQWMWRQWAPYFLDFMATQRELLRTRRLVFGGPTLVVVDLRERAPRAERRAR